MMKKLFFTLFAFISLFVFASSTFAQKQIDQKVQRDPALEADALHNLDVARQYYKNKKAYKAVILRTEEIIAANPDFSKMDEVLFLTGMSSYYLSQNKGKQKLDAKASEADKVKFAPAKLHDDAIGYLAQLIKEYPNSQYKGEAEKTLKSIDAPK